MAVEEDNIFIFGQKTSEALFVFIAREVGEGVEQTVVVINIALAEERITARSVEECVEIKINSLVLIGFKLCLEPVKLFVGYKLNKGKIFVCYLAKENEYVAVCFFAGVYKVISVIRNSQNAVGLVVREHAYVDVFFPCFIVEFVFAVVVTLAGEYVEVMLGVIFVKRCVCRIFTLF